MNVLLVNNDAVITKLIKLTAQKRGDRLDVAEHVEAVREESYDLMILDSGMFSAETLDAINDKAIYAHSLFITTRESDAAEFFEEVLYKPFLPTELLVVLQQFSSSVKKEEEAIAKEIVFDDFENSFFSEDEIAGGEEVIKVEVPAQVHQVVAVAEEPIIEEIEPPLENIFSEEDVSEVKAILDTLEMVDEIIAPIDEVDLELEAALRHLEEGSVVERADELLENSVGEDSNYVRINASSNQESIEALKTLLEALENPVLGKTLRGSITINLSFGEEL